MAKWKYAMVVEVVFFSDGTTLGLRPNSNPDFKENGWALVNDSSVKLNRMIGGTPSYDYFQYPIKYDSHQKKMILEINGMWQDMKNLHDEMKALKPPHVKKNRADLKKKVDSLKPKLDKKSKELSLTWSKRVKEALPKVVHLYVPHDGGKNLNTMSLINKAAEIGWETTGQVPGFPGPTGITMMRLRTD